MRADPEAPGVALELAVLLLRLDRPLDAFSLLSAQIEDASAEQRAPLVPLMVETLERLSEQASRAGDRGEAELYASLLERWRRESG